MPTVLVPGKLVVPSRPQLHDKFLSWVLVRNPNEDTRPGSKADQDAYVWSDGATLVLSQAVTVADNTTRANKKGAQLDAEAQALGTQRLGAGSAGGAVSLVASSNGAQLFAGDLLEYLPTGIFYKVTATGIYQNGQEVPVSAVTTGPQTNLAAGSVLTWVSPRPGVTGNTATVVLQADGSGLSGGTVAESDDDLRARLDYIAANPPASGNDSEYQQDVAEQTAVVVQQCFTYPAVMGPGSIGVTFTLRPSQPGANRIPNATQLAQVLALLAGGMPASDGIYMCSLVSSPTPVVLKVVWAQGNPGWADATTFPLYHPFSVNPGDRLVAASPNAGGVLSPIAFRLSSVSMTEVPQVGQSVGFYDQANLVFRRKKILTVTVISSTTYDITVDTSNGVSDTGYTPINGQACGPWSDSLGTIATPVVSYFDTLGPGEQFASFFDPGLRQKRSPANPQFWPNQLTIRLLGGAAVPVAPQGVQQNQPPVQTVLTTPSIGDVLLAEPTTPYSTPVGTPAVSSYLMTLSPSFVAFPE